MLRVAELLFQRLPAYLDGTLKAKAAIGQPDVDIRRPRAVHDRSNGIEVDGNRPFLQGAKEALAQDDTILPEHVLLLGVVRAEHQDAFLDDGVLLEPRERLTTLVVPSPQEAQ
jgi:hypothetical protein